MCWNVPTYEWARHLATILQPLMGQTTTHVHSAATFCNEIKRFTIDDTEVMVSYDFTFLVSVMVSAFSLFITERLHFFSSWYGPVFKWWVIFLKQNWKPDDAGFNLFQRPTWTGFSLESIQCAPWSKQCLPCRLIHLVNHKITVGFGGLLALMLSVIYS